MADRNPQNPKMKSFIAKLTALTLVTALVGWLVFSLLLPQYYLPVLPWLLIFFYVFTLIIHAYQVKLSKKDFGKFSRSNMLITFVKLIVYSVLAVVYIALDKENAFPFVICLFILYLVFSVFEVSELSKLSRSQKK